MNENNQKKLELLIIEDDPMQVDALRNKMKDSMVFNIDYAFSYREAILKSNQNLFHVVSIDQRLPAYPNGAISDEYGLELCKRLPLYHPLCLGLVYTNFEEIQYAAQINADKFLYLEKTKIKLQDWKSNLIQLANKFQKEIFKNSIPLLPYPLAKLSAQIFDEEKVDIKLHLIQDFWQIGLKLITMQILSILKNNKIGCFKIAKDRLDQKTLISIIENFFKWTKELGEEKITPQLNEWLRFLGNGDGSFLRTLNTLLTYFKESELQFEKEENTADRLYQQMMPDLIVFINTLTYWSRNPIVCEQQIREPGNKISAKIPNGDGTAKTGIWPLGESILPKSTYQLTNIVGEDDTWVLQEISPFVKWKWDNITSSYNLFTLHNPENFEYYNLNTSDVEYGIEDDNDVKEINDFYLT